MFFLKDSEKFFDMDKMLDSVEQSSSYALGLVTNKELKNTLTEWTTLNFKYARGLVSTVTSIQDIAKDTVEKLASKIQTK